ncbi:MAG TPA: DUF192 domain-containing protein [Candidatus Paceibacterota bacterium]|nr:DUF192 domain-containing protein [Candidatus Paceibacterota bacterium]
MSKTLIVVSILAVIAIFLAVAAVYIKPFGVNIVKKNLIVGSHTFEVGIADNIVSRTQGLSGRPSLAENEGLFFIFSSPGVNGFWMKDMNFPIDIVWINGNKVIGFSENLQPQPDKTVFSLPVYYPPGPVDRVLEINAGAVEKYGLKEGDTVSL